MAGRTNFAVVDQAMNTMDKMRQYITAGMDTALDVVTDFENCPTDCDQNKVKELQNIMCEYIQMELELKQFVEAVSQVKETVRGSEDPDLSMVTLLKDELNELEKRDIGIDVKDHVKFKELQTKIRTTIGNASEQEDTVQGDLEMTQASVNTKCPVTGKDMSDPVKNRHCGHKYDREGIKQLMKQRKGRAKCPVAGCGNNKAITDADLDEDKELKRFIEKKNRQGKKK